jgi:DNA-binding response OmpR family regulator
MDDNHYRILVVDDESSICQAFALALAPREFVADVAAKAAQAVKTGAESAHNVLVADLNQPDVEGTEVLREIQACCRGSFPLSSQPTVRRRVSWIGVTAWSKPLS